jgi:hypothetical protein
MSLINALRKHVDEVAGTLGNNERIQGRAQGYQQQLLQGLNQALPMLSKDPQHVTMDDMLSSGIGAMPLSIAGRTAANMPLAESPNIAELQNELALSQQVYQIHKDAIDRGEYLTETLDGYPDKNGLFRLTLTTRNVDEARQNMDRVKGLLESLNRTK